MSVCLSAGMLVPLTECQPLYHFSILSRQGKYGTYVDSLVPCRELRRGKVVQRGAFQTWPRAVALSTMLLQISTSGQRYHK